MKKGVDTMKHKSMSLSLCFMLLSTGILAVTVTADDWPMFRYNAGNTCFSSSQAPGSSHLQWIFPNDDGGVSTPIVVDDRIYLTQPVPPHGITKCLDATTGEELWNVSHGAGTPAVINGLLYTGSTGTDKALYCYDVESQDEVWHYGLASGQSVTVSDGYVFFGSTYHAYCLNAETGYERWVHENLGPMPSIPAVANGRAYFRTTNELLCLDASDGSTIWSHPFGFVGSRVPVFADDRIYMRDSNGKLRCLDAMGNGDGTTDELWSFQCDNDASDPTIAYGHVYIASYFVHNYTMQHLYCLDAEGNGDGTTDIIWVEEAGILPPTIADEKVYAGSIYDKLYCFDAFTGEKLWIYNDADDSRLLKDYSIVVADVNGYGRIFCNFENGLHCLGSVSPETPVIYSSPDQGQVGVEYEFGAITTDPEGLDIAYCFDWGDGSESSWTNYTPSGEPVEVTHIWETSGDFTVKVKAKNSDDMETEWSEAVVIHINRLSLDLSGGFGVNVHISNLGPVPKKVNWTVSIQGGRFFTLEKEFSGTEFQIDASTNATMKTGPIFWLGFVDIQATAECSGEPMISQTARGFALLFVVILL